MDRDEKGKKWEDYDTIRCLDGTIIDMQKLIQEQGKARAALIHLEPMFAAFAPKLKTVYTFHVDTQATDGYHLFVNPQFTNNLTFEEKVFVMAHECMHCVLDHMRRGKQAGHEHQKSNIAADYEVNQTLIDLGLFKAPTLEHIGALLNKKYTGWSYERIYDDSPAGPKQGQPKSGSGNPNNNQNKQDKQNQQQSDNQQSSQNQSQSSQRDEQDKNKQGSQSQSQGTQNQNDQKQQSQDNSSSTQGQVQPRDCTQMGGNTSNPGTFMGTNEGNKIAKEEGYNDQAPSEDSISKDWQQTAIQQAQKDNRTDAHGSRAQFYSKILGLFKTSTDWKKSFKKIIGRSLNTQDRRQAFANKNVLATRSMVARTDKDKFDAVDFITVFIDSSGSMSDFMLKKILSELYSITLSIKPETLVVIQLDTHVQDFQVFRDMNDFKKYAQVVTVKGRGGNRQAACWEFLKNDPRMKHKSSELVIMFTDGYLDQHKRDPKTMQNLCWAIIDNPGFKLENPDTHTSVVYIDSQKIK